MTACVAFDLRTGEAAGIAKVIRAVMFGTFGPKRRTSLEADRLNCSDKVHP